MLTDNDKQQLTSIIQNMEEQTAHVPYVHEILQHPTRGPFFAGLDDADKQSIEQLIHDYMVNKIEGLKTKGGELFRRLYENHTDEFWEFRKLNGDEKNTDTQEFQTLGKKIEDKVFFYEGVLTESMIRNDKGLEKTVSAYHAIVYSFFPLFGRIE